MIRATDQTREAEAATESAHRDGLIAGDKALLLRRQVWAALVLLWFSGGLAWWRASAAWPDAASLATAQTKIDPNSAPWWELSLLPQIGDSLAREIERHRAAAISNLAEPINVPSAQRGTADGSPTIVFGSAADLDKVRGIGPKTVQRLAPHLRFPPNGESAND